MLPASDNLDTAWIENGDECIPHSPQPDETPVTHTSQPQNYVSATIGHLELEPGKLVLDGFPAWILILIAFLFVSTLVAALWRARGNENRDPGLMWKAATAVFGLAAVIACSAWLGARFADRGAEPVLSRLSERIDAVEQAELSRDRSPHPEPERAGDTPTLGHATEAPVVAAAQTAEGVPLEDRLPPNAVTMKDRIASAPAGEVPYSAPIPSAATLSWPLTAIVASLIGVLWLGYVHMRVRITQAVSRVDVQRARAMRGERSHWGRGSHARAIIGQAGALCNDALKANSGTLLISAQTVLRDFEDWRDGGAWPDTIWLADRLRRAAESAPVSADLSAQTDRLRRALTAF